MNARATTRGFTLLELMVSLSIMGILAATAIPHIQGHLQQARRTDAVATLLLAANWLERAATANGQYPLDPNHRGPGLPVGLQQSPGGHYRIDLNSPDGQGFTLTAQPVAQQADEPCGWLQLNERGQRLSQHELTHCW